MDMAEATERWFKSEAIPGVRFRLNEFVAITGGPLSGQSGSTMSLLQLTPEPEYLVELSGSGRDARVRQSDLGAA